MFLEKPSKNCATKISTRLAIFICSTLSKNGMNAGKKYHHRFILYGLNSCLKIMIILLSSTIKKKQIGHSRPEKEDRI